MTPEFLYTLCITLAGAALLLLVGSLAWGRLQRRRVLSRAIERAAQPVFAPPGPGDMDGAEEDASPAFAATQARAQQALWLRTPIARLLVANEDRRLIEQCGWPATRAQLIFMGLRVLLMALLPLLVLLAVEAGWWKTKPALAMGIAFALGFLLPKWLLAAHAARQCEQVRAELPLFVDLLRLLQGVGLSLDQSLQIMSQDFRHVLRVLGREIELANQQYARGRTREHSLQRLASLHDDDSLANLVALLVQIDRHGGAVQEPLGVYSERLRERRRAQLKERIGKTTVKMAGVMVTTLLPALLVVTAGPGFLAIVRSLGGLHQ